MPEIPQHIVIEPSKFHSGVLTEECECVNSDGKLYRFQRRADVSVPVKIARFFKDFFTGTTKAKGVLCDRIDNLPQHIYIRGNRLVRGENHSEYTKPRDELIVPSTESTPKKFSISCDTAINSPVPSYASQTPNFKRIRDDLKGQFIANGIPVQNNGLSSFLEFLADTTRPVNRTDIPPLQKFGLAFETIMGELHQGVRNSVLETLTRLQNQIKSEGRNDVVFFSLLKTQQVAPSATRLPPAVLPRKGRLPLREAPPRPPLRPIASEDLAKRRASDGGPVAAPSQPTPAPPAPAPLLMPAKPLPGSRPTERASQPTGQTLQGARNTLKPVAERNNVNSQSSSASGQPKLAAILAEQLKKMSPYLDGKNDQKGADGKDDNDW